MYFWLKKTWFFKTNYLSSICSRMKKTIKGWKKITKLLLEEVFSYFYQAIISLLSFFPYCKIYQMDFNRLALAKRIIYLSKLRDRCQILLLMLSKFKQKIKFHSLCNPKETYGFLMIYEA